MYNLSAEQKLYFVLRLAVAMCFIGHGAFGIITKPIWANYFAVFGIGHDMAFKLMPWVGAADIALGITMLVYPVRAIAGWLVIWGLVTASLRPLSGEPFAELIERAGNFGAPLCLLMLVGLPDTFKGWFTLISPEIKISEARSKQLTNVLRVLVFLLLAGHGWLNLIHKKGLIDQYTRLGFANPVNVAFTAGMFELFAALTVLVKPVKSLLLILFIWKISTELFYPHWEVFEWVERGGSYGCILALLMSLQFQTSKGFTLNFTSHKTKPIN
ncbi:hypothetical protein [Mucilaginibacter ginkgonis]|uniref:Uncharacterized protein n=1 Tax=Mucilaginibacter ginkgonis TaxID=2682091 RepID=A0A6I4I4Y5_9SPHI|nr:hypothetical protein [Mucilaginibacter ginkgonis]QQL50756.1 hypothetical protein GO620_004665 [Mucilaginibacter ginkgonis]